jgi:hypothetical protein
VKPNPHLLDALRSIFDPMTDARAFPRINEPRGATAPRPREGRDEPSFVAGGRPSAVPFAVGAYITAAY